MTVDTVDRPIAQAGLPPAGLALTIAAVAAATLAGAWFFQLVLDIRPCPLCLEQRYAYYLAIPVALATALAAARGTSRALIAAGFAALVLIGIGTLIGSRFGKISPRTIVGHIRAALGSFAVAIAISAGFVGMIVLTLQVRPSDVIVAFAPGAMDAMLALALTLHIDPVFVGAHHLSRFVYVSIATPGIVHWFGRARDDIDD